MAAKRRKTRKNINHVHCTTKIEAPRSKLRGIFDRKEVCYFSDSLANPAVRQSTLADGECARFCGSNHFALFAPFCG